MRVKLARSSGTAITLFMREQSDFSWTLHIYIGNGQ